MVVDAVAMNNRAKYMKAPTWEQINHFILELGVTVAQFERFYDIPAKTLFNVKTGERALPARFWHIVYERIKPAYGAGFIGEYATKEVKNRIKHYSTKISTVDSTTNTDNHGRLTMFVAEK